MADPAHEATDRKIRALERRIRQVYAEAQRDLEKKTKAFWARHEKKAKQLRKDLAAGKITEEQYESWMRGQVFQGEQWDSKKFQIAQVLTHADEAAQKIINGEVEGVFANNANWMFYSMEQGAGINFGFELYDPTTVARLLRDQPQLLPKYRLDIPKDLRWNKNLIAKQITQGIIQGEDIFAIARRMAKVTDRDRNLCLTRARTAMTGAQNAGRQEAISKANSMGIRTRKEWLATLDGHTRIQHAKLDGQQVEENEKFVVDGFSIRFPGDPLAAPAMTYNCRCTMVADVVEYPEEYNAPRYDNIAGKPIKGMSYKEWYAAKFGQPAAPAAAAVDDLTKALRAAKSAKEVQDLMNRQDWFLKKAYGGRSKVNLTGCDATSARSVAFAYKQVFDRYPQLKGKFFAVDSLPKDMSNNTYAWCYTRGSGRVQVNPKKYKDFSSLLREYQADLACGFHPKGTDANSIVTHEIGHAIDGLISGIRSRGKDFRYVSSTMRNRVMKACGLTVYDVSTEVSRYASKNPREWFAECFAEYMTSENPRRVALAFGKELEEMMKEVK